MPASPPEQLLHSTARSTFESLALLLAEPLGAEPPAGDAAGGAAGGEPLGGDSLGAGPLGPDALGARVAFAGTARGAAVEGALAVRVSAGVAAALAENMLGADAAGEAARRDAVGELANVVCGHVLSEAGGPLAVFRLEAPEPAAGGALEADAPGAWQAWFDVEGGVACVALEAPAALFGEAA